MARQRGLDSRAVLAVSRAEGLSGGIGDGGHAFGPFQENDAGGVLTGRFPGLSADQKQSWAWSQAGVADALDRISHVAKGQHGRQAVESIVRRFERPADPNGEVSRALAGYGSAGSSRGMTPDSAGGGGSSPPPAPSPPFGAQPSSSRRDLLLALAQTPISQQQTPFLNALYARNHSPAAQPAAQPGPAAPPPPTPAAAPAPERQGGILAELLHEGVGGPTHSTGEHIHVALTDPKAMLAAISEAQSLGLSVRENPYVDPVDPVHAPHSYHTRDFPGLYNGRRLGQATDASGAEPAMLAFQKWVRQRYGSPAG